MKFVSKPSLKYQYIIITRFRMTIEILDARQNEWKRDIIKSNHGKKGLNVGY